MPLENRDCYLEAAYLSALVIAVVAVMGAFVAEDSAFALGVVVGVKEELDDAAEAAVATAPFLDLVSTLDLASDSDSDSGSEEVEVPDR